MFYQTRLGSDPDLKNVFFKTLCPICDLSLCSLLSLSSTRMKLNPAACQISKTLRDHLDVGIGDIGIEFVIIPNQASFGIGLQYQICCLDSCN